MTQSHLILIDVVEGLAEPLGEAAAKLLGMWDQGEMPRIQRSRWVRRHNSSAAKTVDSFF